MYENHHDFEALFRADRVGLEQRLEECRKLKACRIKSKLRDQHSKLSLLLLAFRNIFIS